MVQARQAERQVALERLNEERACLDPKLQEVVDALAQFEGLQTALNAARERARETTFAIGQCRAERDRAIARQAQAEQRLQQIEKARVRETVVEGELANARMERDDFDDLAKAFGPDEIQLCEIQSAGPGVSVIVNDLLEGYFDNKFEVRFRTQRPKADGRGFVDDFDIEVRNKTLDRTCVVDELSGGQFVLVNEAVNLGIAIYNMRQGKGFGTKRFFGTKRSGPWMRRKPENTFACSGTPR